jgi:uncharacterized protein YjbI with pentapeptide repeats
MLKRATQRLVNLIKNVWKRKFLALFLILVMSIAGLVLYWAIWPDSSPEWTGFGAYDKEASGPRAKTLWDWMELLLIPLVLAGGGLFLNRAQRQRELEIAAEERDTERQIAKDREEERALQSYLEAMTELLLEKELRISEEGSEVRSIARARTLTMLRSLSGERKGSILRFLYEAKLINRKKTVIDLSGANLEGANLRRAWLLLADLEEANLKGANLGGAMLERAYLVKANLGKAILYYANLGKAILYYANLEGANLESACLEGAELSVDSILPDGTKWTPDTDMARFTDPNHPDFWQPDAE